MVEEEVEAGEVEGPPGLPTVELLGHHEILQVLVVRPNLAFVRGVRGPGIQVDSKVPIFDRAPTLIYYM